jgi:hypothetical protein
MLPEDERKLHESLLERTDAWMRELKEVISNNNSALSTLDGIRKELELQRTTFWIVYSGTIKFIVILTCIGLLIIGLNKNNVCVTEFGFNVGEMSLICKS